MKLINLKDENFTRQEYSSPFHLGASFQWDRNCLQEGPTVYTDMYLRDELSNIAGEKICWLVEPVSIYPHIYQWITVNHTLFSEVWTHDDEVLKLIPNARFVPTGGCWVDPASIGISDKSKLCSFIASNKDWTTGHQLRQKIRTKLPEHIQQFGKGYKEIANKAEALSEYAYSIVVENTIRDTYFSEKIIDCFLTGTLPVYWGTAKVCDYFNAAGIKFFNTVEELLDIVKALSMEDYYKRSSAIKENFEIAKQFVLAEEWAMKKTYCIH